MKISLKWLEQYVDVSLPPAELAQKLTMAGIEVSGWQVIGGDWENIVVGQIVAIDPHPNADRLKLPTVDLGTEQLTVVCGASNLKVGDKVAFARVGARLIDGHSGKVIKLESAKIRGVASNGMVCSERELGVSDYHEDIMVLAAGAPVGMSLAEFMGDVILDLDITPNRPDCLSVIGIAREVAALTGQEVRQPDIGYDETGAPIDRQIAVEIIAPDLCPRYSASLITGVKIAPSPLWLQQRVLAGGMRPINNVVDITNFVMLEYGEPLHAFDYNQIRGQKIIVRRAEEAEVLVTLDGARRSLSRDMLVIADSERAVAVAGVMGGADSEMTDQTTAIVLEAASFNPASIYHTGSTLGLPSEARMRFERGISPELTIPALRRATRLIIELASGQAAKGIVDAYPGKQVPKPILLSKRELKRQLGVDFSLEQIKTALTSLGFDCQPAKSASEISVTAPYWRSDISLVEDLVEEIARVVGYDQIPITMPSGEVPRQNPAPILAFKQEVRRDLAGFGFQEVITYSLTSLDLLNRLLPEAHPLEPEPLRVVRPMTAEQEYLRPSLRANLLAALEANRRHEGGGIRLFELGRVYQRRPNDLPDEPEMLCGLMAGSRFDESWHGGDEPVDFFDAKGVVEGLLGRLGMTADFRPGDDESLHPAKQAAIVIGDKEVGVVGELHHKVVEAFDLAEKVYMMEINLNELLPFTLEHKLFQPISRFPAVVRDIALVVGSGVTHRQVLDIITGFPLVTKVALFDLYTGGKLPAGKKSLAYRITFQSPSKTLTDEAANSILKKIIDKLAEELGATLRG
jgi:phenylalanyl-tRNA synthetase beta chain